MNNNTLFILLLPVIGFGAYIIGYNNGKNYIVDSVNTKLIPGLVADYEKDCQAKMEYVGNYVMNDCNNFYKNQRTVNVPAPKTPSIQDIINQTQDNQIRTKTNQLLDQLLK